jgi:glycosyltransferase involved in cell wall biosynthesis
MNLDEPWVTMIIPIFNRAGLIEKTLQSTIAQIYQNCECIFIDDFSFNNTKNVIQK